MDTIALKNVLQDVQPLIQDGQELHATNLMQTEPTASNGDHFTVDVTSKPLKKLPTRQRHAILGLLNGPLMREQLDRVIGCSNSPEYVSKLRKKGIDIECVKIDAIDRDGEPCKPGLYSLTSEGRLMALQYLLVP